MVRREEIMDVIKRVYYNLKRENCPVHHVNSKDLKDYTTTEKDMKKGSSRHPPPNLRNRVEDLFDEEETKRAGSSEAGTPETFGTEEDLAAK